MNRRGRRKADGEKIFSIVASLAIVAALVVGVVSIVKSTTGGKDKNYIDLNVADNETTVEEQSTARRVVEAETTTKAPEETPSQTPAADEAAGDEQESPVAVNSQIFSFGESSSLLWPVSGDIILGYNMTNTIYFPTLKEYRCNPAAIISAEVGTQVVSAAPGIVENIYEDNKTGTTMIVSIGNGYKLKYGQLANLVVGISDTVEAGTLLGTVDEPTKYYSVEGSNLYFELTSNDAPVDPMLYLIEK